MGRPSQSMNEHRNQINLSQPITPSVQSAEKPRGRKSHTNGHTVNRSASQRPYAVLIAPDGQSFEFTDAPISVGRLKSNKPKSEPSLPPTEVAKHPSNNQSIDQSSSQTVSQSISPSTKQSTDTSSESTILLDCPHVDPCHFVIQWEVDPTHHTTNNAYHHSEYVLQIYGSSGISVGQSNSQSNNQSNNQSTNQSNDQSNNQSINQSTDQSNNQPIEQSTQPEEPPYIYPSLEKHSFIGLFSNVSNNQTNSQAANQSIQLTIPCPDQTHRHVFHFVCDQSINHLHNQSIHQLHNQSITPSWSENERLTFQRSINQFGLDIGKLKRKLPRKNRIQIKNFIGFFLLKCKSCTDAIDEKQFIDQMIIKKRLRVFWQETTLIDWKKLIDNGSNWMKRIMLIDLIDCLITRAKAMRIDLLDLLCMNDSVKQIINHPNNQPLSAFHLNNDQSYSQTSSRLSEFSKPATWWTRDHDRCFLECFIKYGYGRYDEYKHDLMSVHQSNNQSINQTISRSLKSVSRDSDDETDDDESMKRSFTHSSSQPQTPMSGATNQSNNQTSNFPSSEALTRRLKKLIDPIKQEWSILNQSINQPVKKPPKPMKPVIRLKRRLIDPVAQGSKQKRRLHLIYQPSVHSINQSTDRSADHLLDQSQLINQPWMLSEVRSFIHSVIQHGIEYQSANPTINQSNNQTINKMMNQSTKQLHSNGQTINPMIYRMLNQSNMQIDWSKIFIQSINQPISHSKFIMCETVFQQLVDCYFIQLNNQSINPSNHSSSSQSINDSILQVFNKSVNNSSNVPTNQAGDNPTNHPFNQAMYLLNPEEGLALKQSLTFFAKLRQRVLPLGLQSFTQLIHQSISQMHNHTAPRSIKHSITQAINQAIKRSNDLPVWFRTTIQAMTDAGSIQSHPQSNDQSINRLGNHDWCLLLGISKHGIGAWQSIIKDDSLGWGLNHIASNPADNQSINQSTNQSINQLSDRNTSPFGFAKDVPLIRANGSLDSAVDQPDKPVFRRLAQLTEPEQVALWLRAQEIVALTNNLLINQSLCQPGSSLKPLNGTFSSFCSFLPPPDRLFSHFINRPINQSIKQTNNRPVNQSAHQYKTMYDDYDIDDSYDHRVLLPSINQSINQLINVSTNQSPIQLVYRLSILDLTPLSITAYASVNQLASVFNPIVHRPKKRNHSMIRPELKRLINCSDVSFPFIISHQIDQSVVQSADQLINQTFNRSIKQPINQTNHVTGGLNVFDFGVIDSQSCLMDRMIGQMIICPIGFTSIRIHQSINQINSRSINQSITQPSQQPVLALYKCEVCLIDSTEVTHDELINQSINQSIKSESPKSEMELSVEQPKDDQTIVQTKTGASDIVASSNSQSINQTINQSINQSSDQSTNQTNNQSINQSSDQKNQQSVDSIVNQSTKQSKRIAFKVTCSDSFPSVFNLSNNQSDNQSNNQLLNSSTLVCSTPQAAWDIIDQLISQSINQSNNQASAYPAGRSDGFERFGLIDPVIRSLIDRLNGIEQFPHYRPIRGVKPIVYINDLID